MRRPDSMPSYEQSIPQNLQLTIPTNGLTTASSSADSSLAPTPTTPTGIESSPTVRGPPGILNLRSRSSSLPPSQRSSTSSVDSPADSTLSLNVKFAPLPELAPRKRKSATPLGVAARSQMMRRRRQMAAYGGDPNQPSSGSPMWTTAEVEEHRRRQRDGDQEAAEDIEDPFVTFGKMVKRTWQKMANKEVPPKDKATDEKGVTPSPVVVVGVTSTEKRAVLATIAPPNDSPHDEGRVWEEAVGETFQNRDIGQTETIREDGNSDMRLAPVEQRDIYS